LEQRAPGAARRGGAHDGTERARDPALAADHLADVVLRDMQLDDRVAVALDLLDAHRVRLVDEAARQVLDDLDRQPTPFTFSRRATVEEGCAPLESQSRTRSSSSSIVDGSVCGL